MNIPFPQARARLLRVVYHPLLPFGIGVTMVVTSLTDIAEAFASGAALSIGMEHGVLLWGLTTAARALLEFLQGVEKVRDAVPAIVHHSPASQDTNPTRTSGDGAA